MGRSRETMSTRKRGAKTPGKTPGKTPKTESKKKSREAVAEEEKDSDMVLITREELEELRAVKLAWEKTEVLLSFFFFFFSALSL